MYCKSIKEAVSFKAKGVKYSDENVDLEVTRITKWWDRSLVVRGTNWSANFDYSMWQDGEMVCYNFGFVDLNDQCHPAINIKLYRRMVDWVKENSRDIEITLQG